MLLRDINTSLHGSQCKALSRPRGPSHGNYSPRVIKRTNAKCSCKNRARNFLAAIPEKANSNTDLIHRTTTLKIHAEPDASMEKCSASRPL